MASFTKFRQILKQVRVVKAPRHRLSTFGESKIDYTLITDVPGMPDRSRLRHGQVAAEKPTLITPDTLKERFAGFGSEAKEYSRWLTSQYGEALRGLEYQFKNDPAGTSVELLNPDKMTEKLSQEFDHAEYYRHALIRGTDKLWEIAIMKFIVEETLSSFAHNVQELQDRGFFDEEDRDDQRRRREIQHMLSKAETNKALIPTLGKKLKEYGLFEDFQDQFFRLLKS